MHFKKAQCQTLCLFLSLFLMEIFDINHILFTLWGYEVCLLELAGTVLGVLAVWLATQAKSVNFLVSIVGMLFLAVFFYQKGLYSSLILQLILCGFCALGFYNWTKKTGKDNTEHSRKITVLTNRQRLAIIAITLAFVGIWGSMMIFFKPDFLQVIFPEEYSYAALGYFDAFVLIASMLGMFLRAQKKLDNWYIFLCSDTMGVILYALSGAYFVTMMCSIYFLLDIKAIVSWRKEMVCAVKNSTHH